ncbi:fibronectin type III domain-containing protein [Candidatus Poriferisocius sp.]|uniref:fibronectin type III domain-containing protein n=1 Tax=Candidatus Poriferisocius sp. TaxID=3101276 RepID=UPI003B011044
MGGGQPAPTPVTTPDPGTTPSNPDPTFDVNGFVSGIQAQPSGRGAIRVTWDGYTGADNYDVYYDTTNNFLVPSTRGARQGITARNVTLTGLTPGTRYYIWVHANDGTGRDSRTNSLPTVTSVSSLAGT